MNALPEPSRETPPETPFRQLLASLLANGAVSLAGGDESLVREARTLSDELLSVNSGSVSSNFAFRLEQLVDRMKCAGSEHLIGEASNITDLSEVVGELMLGTLQTQESTLRTGHELTGLHEQVDSANREIARLQHELEMASKLMRHDPLTGVYNRKGLTEAITREVSRARRKDSSLCIALIDVDDFKNVNDIYGHGIGDEALCHLAHTLTETLRPQDVVARYGGEEFIILLPDTTLDAANSILVRLQRELTHRIFFPFNNEPLLITFSAGVALLCLDEDPEAAISRADEAMYAAKRAGKNRVLSHSNLPGDYLTRFA